MILILNVALSLGVITAVVGGLAASIFPARTTHPRRTAQQTGGVSSWLCGGV